MPDRVRQQLGLGLYIRFELAGVAFRHLAHGLDVTQHDVRSQAPGRARGHQDARGHETPFRPAPVRDSRVLDGQLERSPPLQVGLARVGVQLQHGLDQTGMAVAGRVVQYRVAVLVAGVHQSGRVMYIPHRAGHVAILHLAGEQNDLRRHGQIRAEVRLAPPLQPLIDRFNDIIETAVARHDQGRGRVPVGIDALVGIGARGHERGNGFRSAVYHRVMQGAVFVEGSRIHTHQMGCDGQNGIQAFHVSGGGRLAKFGHGEGAGGRLVRHFCFSSSKSSLSSPLSATRWPYRSS